MTERFDTGDGHLTPHEARELHLEVHAEMRHRPRLLYFELKPAAELAAGKAKQAFADYRKLAHTPPTALDAVRLAEGLRRFGLGGLARTWARKATVLDPKRVLAWTELGRTLSADVFGREFHRGMDRAGAIAAYRHALGLQETALIHQNLGALYERNDVGQAFGAGADLDKAVVELRAARKLDPSRHRDLALMGALIHAGRFDAAVKLGEKASASHRRNLLLLSAVALRDGVDAARTRAAALASDGNPSLLLIQTTGALLAFRAYPQALALAQAVGFDRLGSVGTLLANAGDRLRRSEAMKPAAGPVGLVQALVPHAAGDVAGDLRRWLVPRVSRRLPPDKLYPGLFRVPGADGSSLGMLATAIPGLMGDLAAAVSEVKDDGVAGGVHRIRVTTTDSGDDGVSYYVVHEGAADRLLCSGAFTAPLGHDALAALDAGHLDDARTLLDWAYKGSASPRLMGLVDNPMPELWGKDKPRTAEAAKRAALALVALGDHPRPALAPLAKILAHTRRRQAKVRDALSLALAAGLSETGQSARAVRLARVVAAHHDEQPYRRMAFAFAQGAKGTGLLKTLLAVWGKAHSDELSVIFAREAVAVREHRFPAAVKALQALIDDGKENPVVDNELANFTLFGQLDLHRGLKLAEKAVRGSDRKDAASLNTLATLQATQGHDAEALRTLLAGMALHEEGKASPSDWYVVGLIQAHLGFPAAAARSYARVAKDREAASAESYWVLARKRLAVLNAKGVKVPTVNPGAPAKRHRRQASRRAP